MREQQPSRGGGDVAWSRNHRLRNASHPENIGKQELLDGGNAGEEMLGYGSVFHELTRVPLGFLDQLVEDIPSLFE